LAYGGANPSLPTSAFISVSGPAHPFELNNEMYFVYILKSKKDNNLYIGSTNNIKKRMKEHNGGKVFSTKPRIPSS
jgi:hypothetical protein